MSIPLVVRAVAGDAAEREALKTARSPQQRRYVSK